MGSRLPKRMAMLLSPGFVFLALLTNTSAQTGAIRQVHDPCIIKEKNTYYLFSTGRGIRIRTSTDLIQWNMRGRVFDATPEWTLTEVPGSRGYYWAPDISFFNGKFHLYYSVSTFGSRRSCIGLATNMTLNPQDKNYRWVDEGKVIESRRSDDWNAIDPNILLDETGAPWLSLGSFWSGIKITQINPRTGKPLRQSLESIAARPGNSAVEAPFIIHQNGFYYLFVSWDYCCKGVNSDYKIVVGRSKNVTGPYSDRAGKPMLKGGGTLVLASYERYRGPGHNAVLREDQKDWLVHHFYDADNRGAPTLQVRPLLWAEDGWPLAGEPYAGAELDEKTGMGHQITGVWQHSVDFRPGARITLSPDGRIGQGPASWSLAGSALSLRWPRQDAPNQVRVDRCILSGDGLWYVGRDEQGAVVRGRKVKEKSDLMNGKTR